MAFDLAPFHILRHHGNDPDLELPNHAPKVTCGLGHWTLRGDVVEVGLARLEGQK